MSRDKVKRRSRLATALEWHAPLLLAMPSDAVLFERAAAICSADGQAFFTFTSPSTGKTYSYRLSQEPDSDSFRLLDEERFTLIRSMDDLIVYFAQIEQHTQMGLDGRTPTSIAKVLLRLQRHIKPVTSKMRSQAEKQLKDQIKLFKGVYLTPPPSANNSRRPSAVSISSNPSHNDLMPTVSRADMSILGKKPQFVSEGLLFNSLDRLELVVSREIVAPADFDETDLSQIDSNLEQAELNRDIARVEAKNRDPQDGAVGVWRKARQKIVS